MFHNTPLEQDVQAFAAIINELNIPDAANKIEDFRSLLLSEESPEQFYDDISYGAYKECYALSPDYVIKFATEDNASETEMSLLSRAFDARVGEVFLPTHFFWLHSCTLPTYYIERESEGYYNSSLGIYTCDTTNEDMNAVFIQPRIAKLAEDIDSTTLYFNEKEYAQNPLYVKGTNEIVRFSLIRRLHISCYNWVQDVLDLYGYEFLERLADFIEENEMRDLHWGNIGWTQDRKPVIIDWLSA